MSVELAFRERGRGQPLLLLHGLFGSAANWGVVARALADRFRVFALDLRNHGQSPHRPTMTYPEMAGDLLRFLDQHRLEQPVIVGHSMGGKVAMLTALTAPERVRALVAVDIAPVTYVSDRFNFVAALQQLPLAALRDREQADALLADTIPNAGGREFLLTNLQRQTHGGFRWRLNLDAIAASVQEVLGFPDPGPWQTYAGPALFLAGADSTYVQAEHENRILELFPQAHVERLAGVGHNPHTEAPDAAIAAIGAFCAGLQEVSS